ncbi:IS6 family transposase [Dehalogenimonas sp. 4OHTPN]|uniref:IS6 family transposase n=1 Tax=Dehalogenimonas sp. 4OHTPN TaxID=3166643 RepID=A0AAU8GBT4_9CHLR
MTLNELIPCECKHCGSRRTRRYGHSKAQKQRWLCNDCCHTFIESDAQPGMRVPPDQVASAVSMFYEGLSLTAICRQMKQIHGYEPSDGTVYRWITKYTREAIDRTKDIKPAVGDVWLCDETVLKIGGKNVWFYDIIDVKTRFLLASHIADKRYLGDARMVLNRAGNKAGKKPKVVITDSLNSYPQAIGDVFGTSTRHIKYKGITQTPNNNILERFHGTLKARTKVMRGLKGYESAKLFTAGWLIFYNFMRPHESLHGKTPADRAGTQMPSHNWHGVVRNTPVKVETVTWLEKPPPELRGRIPTHIKQAIGMVNRMPKGLR